MAGGIVFMQWESYQSNSGAPIFFEQEALTFNSRQERLHQLSQGNRLWLVSRCPNDQQYYFIAALSVDRLAKNPPESKEGQFGEFAVVADRSKSHDLGKRFPADGLLRALEFETAKPIKYGASIGQSLQTLRLLARDDEQILDKQLDRILSENEPAVDVPFGLWTKCDRVFADYFVKNWKARREPMAFLLYDPPPVLRLGSPIFIHSDKNLRLLAHFTASQFVAGHKSTSDEEERIAERERVWTTYRAGTIDPPSKSDYNTFWNAQNGVRGLFVMGDIVEVPHPVPFKQYGRALEWGYPIGVAYRYLSFSQTLLLLRLAKLSENWSRD
jgi:hypothetical protein